MPAPIDALAQIDDIAIDEAVQEASTKRNGINTEHDDIAADRESIHEISRMADRLTSMLQEIRNNQVETDDRLRAAEADLKLLELER